MLKFLRSVIPGDSWQLLFLAGTIFLYIAPRLGWWPKSILPLDVTPEQRTDFFLFISVAIWLVIVASLVAYFLCFWSGTKGILYSSLGVLLPAIVGLGCIFNRYFQLSYSRRSVLQSRGDLAAGYEWFGSNIGRWPTGVYFCVAGLFLMFACVVRVRLGISSLPISLLGLEGSEENSWNRYKWVIFLLLGPYSALAGLFGLLLSLPFLLRYSVPVIMTPYFTSVAAVLDSVVPVGLVLLILGKMGRDALRKSMQLPEPPYAFLGPLFAVGISLMCATLPYVVERIHWAAHDFGKMEPPQFLDYFRISHAWDAWLLLLTFGALAEEIIFRGVLLPRSMQRYGFWRGMFFTGLVWGALHFRADSYTGFSVPGVLYHLLWRVLFCLALNYVFSWMTLRWKSVIPSAAAHALWNIVAIGGVNGAVPWHAELSVVLWAVLAALLFRYWPPIDEQETAIAAPPDSVAAV